MIICIPVPAYIIFSCFYDPFWVKNDIGTGIHNMIIHYNCTIDSILLHSFLLICHLHPPSFHEMIFTLVPLIFLLVVAKLERQAHQVYIMHACAKMIIRMRISPCCAHVLVIVTRHGVFSKTVLAACRCIPR